MKKKKRPAIRIAACILTAALLLVSCGGNPSPEQQLDPNHPVSIRIWHYYNSSQKTAMDEMVAEFNDTLGLEKGIVVQAVSQGNISELTEKVVDAANGKVGAESIPEIFAAYADTAQQVDQMGLVADLESYFTEEEKAAYMPGYLEEGRIGSPEALKILPVAKSTEVMMVNKTDWERFAQATGATLESLSTMEGLVQTAKQYYEWTDSLTPAPNDGLALWGRDAMANYFIIGAKQLGMEIFEVKDGKVTFHTDEAIIRRLWDNYYIPMVNGWFGAYLRFRSDDAKTGSILALVGSTSGASYFPDKVTISDTESHPIQAVALPVPRFEGGKAVAVQQGAGMVVSKSDPKTEYAATLFLKWFTEEERNIRFSIESGYLPVKTAANDMEKIQAAITSEEGKEIVQKLSVSLPVSINSIKENEMYTSKAFTGGTKARNVLEYSLSEKIIDDLKQMESLVAGGSSRAEAAAQFTTEENFQTWYTSFQQALTASIE